jgi:predicted RNase H-like HicB family nuclease
MTANVRGEGSRQEIHLTQSEDWWAAKDIGTGIASQGRTRIEALENLDEAVALYRGEVGRPPTDEEVREYGIDPTRTSRTASFLMC